ncbi:hypothetical protein IA69_18575 [Massilia sp. JS1662]|nr:hypothetical protein IA69_18575 [Massilia sp. JS1662]
MDSRNVFLKCIEEIHATEAALPWRFQETANSASNIRHKLRFSAIKKGIQLRIDVRKIIQILDKPIAIDRHIEICWTQLSCYRYVRSEFLIKVGILGREIIA